MSAIELQNLVRLLEVFKDDVDKQDSESIAGARTLYLANRLLQQHMENRTHLLTVISWAKNKLRQQTLTIE